MKYRPEYERSIDHIRAAFQSLETHCLCRSSSKAKAGTWMRGCSCLHSAFNLLQPLMNDGLHVGRLLLNSDEWRPLRSQNCAYRSLQQCLYLDTRLRPCQSLTSKLVHRPARPLRPQELSRDLSFSYALIQASLGSRLPREPLLLHPTAESPAFAELCGMTL